MAISSVPAPPHAELPQGSSAGPVVVLAAEPVESTTSRVLRVLRTLVVGGSATAADFGTLALCVRVLGLDPTLARSIALVAGCLVLFFGYRSFAFRAQAGSVSRQAALFVISEIVGLPLNLLLFRQFSAFLPGAAPELMGLAANFVSFVVYYYPVRRLVVFRVPPVKPQALQPSGSARP